MSNYNLLVYKYGGQQSTENHLNSKSEQSDGSFLIARTGLNGKLPKNKNIGDDVLVISLGSGDQYHVTYGKYAGLDPKNRDIWKDPSSTYDRTCVEKWKPIKTKAFTKEEFLADAVIGSGTYNDNGKNASRWLDMMLS